MQERTLQKEEISAKDCGKKDLSEFEVETANEAGTWWHKDEIKKVINGLAGQGIVFEHFSFVYSILLQLFVCVVMETCFLFSFLCSWYLGYCQAHSKCSIKVCCINELKEKGLSYDWRNTVLTEHEDKIVYWYHLSYCTHQAIFV